MYVGKKTGAVQPTPTNTGWTSKPLYTPAGFDPEIFCSV
jgi:hypothetical protein